jgi:ADP-heptose:LPS heptosyltransferase
MNLTLETKIVIKQVVFFIVERLASFFNKNKPIDKAKIKKILIFESGGIGDLLRIFPAVSALRANFHNASISILVRPHAKEALELFEEKDIIDEVINYEHDRMHKSFLKKLLLIQSLRKHKYDLIYVPSKGQGMREHILMAFLMRAPHRVGFTKNGTGFLNTLRIEFKDDVPILKQNLDLLHACNLLTKDKLTRIKISEKDMVFARKFLGNANHYPTISIHPAAWWMADYRMWPLDRYIDLIRRLKSIFDARIIIIGGTGDVKIGKEIEKGITGAIINAIGNTTVSQMAAIIKLSHLFIGNDSGPLHIASLVETPFIGIFGPTSPVQVLTNMSNGVSLHKKLSCSPCYLHQPSFIPSCGKPNCPPCIEAVSVDDVIEAIAKIINLKVGFYANRN